MMNKVTVIAPSNIAFLKYWGAVDLDQALPANVSLSMTLSRCVTRTTIERLSNEQPTTIEIGGWGVGAGALAGSEHGELRIAGPGFAGRVEAHLQALRRELGVAGRFRIATANTFPSSAGIASSASGFAALATGLAAFSDRQVSVEELSGLARRSGSGSAARSVLGGYVEWPGEPEDATSPARQVAPPEHWELCDVIAVVSSEPKGVSSRDGHLRAPSSPHFARRQELLPARLAGLRRAILDRDLEALGTAIEAEAIELHLVAMSSHPPIFYWLPSTLAVLARVRSLRDEGIAVWATMDAGPNVHMICEPQNEAAVAEAVDALQGVERLILDRVGSGPRRSDEHLF